MVKKNKIHQEKPNVETFKFLISNILGYEGRIF